MDQLGNLDDLSERIQPLTSKFLTEMTVKNIFSAAG
jgi:hypothetical protein